MIHQRRTVRIWAPDRSPSCPLVFTEGEEGVTGIEFTSKNCVCIVFKNGPFYGGCSNVGGSIQIFNSMPYHFTEMCTEITPQYTPDEVSAWKKP